MDYRGGRIEVHVHSGEVTAIKLRTMQSGGRGSNAARARKKWMRFTAVCLRSSRQRHVKRPHVPGDRDFWDMGPDGQRIIQLGVLLYEGRR